MLGRPKYIKLTRQAGDVTVYVMKLNSINTNLLCARGLLLLTSIPRLVSPSRRTSGSIDRYPFGTWETLLSKSGHSLFSFRVMTLRWTIVAGGYEYFRLVSLMTVDEFCRTWWPYVDTRIVNLRPRKRRRLWWWLMKAIVYLLVCNQVSCKKPPISDSFKQ